MLVWNQTQLNICYCGLAERIDKNLWFVWCLSVWIIFTEVSLPHKLLIKWMSHIKHFTFVLTPHIRNRYNSAGTSTIPRRVITNTHIWQYQCKAIAMECPTFPTTIYGNTLLVLICPGSYLPVFGSIHFCHFQVVYYLMNHYSTDIKSHDSKTGFASITQEIKQNVPILNQCKPT